MDGWIEMAKRTSLALGHCLPRIVVFSHHLLRVLREMMMAMTMIASSPNNDGRNANANVKEGSISADMTSISGNDTHNVAKEDADLLDSFWLNSFRAGWSVVDGIGRECIGEEASGTT